MHELTPEIEKTDKSQQRCPSKTLATLDELRELAYQQ